MSRFDPLEVVGYDKGYKVKYLGCTDDQVRYGGHDDPRPYLDIGQFYEVANVNVHDWCTDVELVDYPGLQFNSVCFEEPNND